WSTKARGGYAELLFLGQALLLITLALAPSPRRRLALLWGVLAGLTFWTHLLAVVYLLPAVIYLALGRRPARGEPRRSQGVQPHTGLGGTRWSVAELALMVVGAVFGMAPLLVETLANGFGTLNA